MNKCPRCQAQLVRGTHESFCLNHHGALLPLVDFREETTPSFTKWFFAAWMRLGNKRTIECPACATKMVQLTVQEKPSFELDCCPNCFALWLDAGEEELLKDLFVKHTQKEKIADLSQEQNEVIGKIIIGHDRTLERYKKIETITKMMNRRVRGFSRRFWF